MPAEPRTTYRANRAGRGRIAYRGIKRNTWCAREELTFKNVLETNRVRYTTSNLSILKIFEIPRSARLKCILLFRVASDWRITTVSFGLWSMSPEHLRPRVRHKLSRRGIERWTGTISRERGAKNPADAGEKNIPSPFSRFTGHPVYRSRGRHSRDTPRRGYTYIRRSRKRMRGTVLYRPSSYSLETL